MDRHCRPIRKRNLNEEVKKRRQSGQKKIHELLGFSSSRLSQLLSGRVPITNDMARKIEDIFELQSHSLDAQVFRGYVFLSFSKFNLEDGAIKTSLTQVINNINTEAEGKSKPVLRLDYLLGEWDAVLEVRCLYLEQIKEIVSTINAEEELCVAKCNTSIALGDSERFD